ncbi:MAG: sn-glycerol 3-phosphate transport system permease protein [Moorella sp. (in: firmicutes)]|nr:sn-glycerol 3-phosphate transport system permease protein [Moorella sp. (in: firmicutes)]
MKTKFPGWHFLLLLVAFISMLPLIWMLATAWKTPEQIFTASLNPWPNQATLANFTYVIGAVPLSRYIFNTFLIAVVVTAAKLVTSILAAYGFTQFTFRGRDTLFYLCLLSIFVPFTVTMMPNYLFMSRMGWLNTYTGVALPQMADALGIFLLRQSIRSIPPSLVEAARLDRVGHGRILGRVLLPAIKPSLIALGILFFINTWNEYFWPLLMINDKSMYTLPLALQMFTNLEGGTNWGAMMAAATLASLPPLVAYLLAQRYVMDTFVQSGLKG